MKLPIVPFGQQHISPRTPRRLKRSWYVCVCVCKRMYKGGRDTFLVHFIMLPPSSNKFKLNESRSYSLRTKISQRDSFAMNYWIQIISKELMKCIVTQKHTRTHTHEFSSVTDRLALPSVCPFFSQKYTFIIIINQHFAQFIIVFYIRLVALRNWSKHTVNGYVWTAYLVRSPQHVY